VDKCVTVNDNTWTGSVDVWSEYAL